MRPPQPALQLNGGLDRGDDIAVNTISAVVQHAQIDEVHRRSDSGVLTARGTPVTSDDSGDVRSVPIYVDGPLDPKGLAVEDPCFASGRIVDVRTVRDAAVNDRNADSFSVPTILPADLGVHRRGSDVEQLLKGPVRRDVDDIGIFR